MGESVVDHWRLAQAASNRFFLHTSFPLHSAMTMKPKSETSPPAATPAAPRVVWHLYYQDPAHDIVLISSDNISFRVSVFRLSGAR